MNALVSQKTQLPAHLAHLTQNAALMGINASAGAGISAGGWPSISIKGSRFRLKNPQGEEVVVNTLDLDVIVVDANPHGLSKVYYAGAYDPSVEDKSPDCYSDNGIGPSSKAAKPQCGTCQACPNNVWGSKINPSGSQSKSCADYKKLAVLIANNPDGPVFELRIPPASLKNWANYIDALDKRGIPAAAIVTKLKFDTSADYPKLVFEASGWSTQEQAAAVMEVIGTEEVDQCTGKNDKPVAGNVALSSSVTPQALPPVPPVNIPLPPAPPAVMTTAPLPPLPPRAEMPPVLQAGNIIPAAPAAKRTRKKGDNFVAAPPQADDNTPLPPALAGMAIPPSAAATAAPLVAQPTSAALDDLIQKAMAT